MIPFADLPPDLSDHFGEVHRRPPLVRTIEDEPLAGLPPRERDVNDFRPGTIDVRLKLAFDGVGNGPLSLFGSIIGWNELGFGVDVGVLGEEDITIGVGGEVYVASPVAFYLFSTVLFDLLSPNAQIDWSAAETGLLGRVTVHYNALKTINLYGAGLAGPNTYGFRARVVDSDGDELRARFRTTGFRVGIAGGATHTWDSNWTLSGELRYLVTPRLKRATEIELVDANGEPAGTFDTVAYQRGPKGFSWQIMVGRRF